MKIIIIFAIVFCCIQLSAQEVDPVDTDNTSNYKPVVLGLVYPVSTNSSKQDSTNLSLALIQNTVGEVKGLNLCGFSAISTGSVKGVQTSILYSQINDNLKGISFSTINVVNDSVRGIQIGVAASILGRSFKGYQTSGVVNFVGGKFTGYQQSTVYNIVGNSFSGLQVGGAGNVVGGDFRGIQLGTTFNFVGKVLKGLQWSGVNVCAESKGVQIGWGNIAQINRGWQIGLMNLSEEQNGIPVGLINISDDSDVQWQSYISNFAGFITAVRFKSNNFISSLEVGGPNLESGIDESAMIGFHYGYRLPYKRFGAEADLGFFHVIYEPENEESDIPNSFALQLRFSATFRVTDWLEIYGGVGGTTMADYVLDEDAETIESEDRFLYFSGINLF